MLFSVKNLRSIVWKPWICRKDNGQILLVNSDFRIVFQTIIVPSTYVYLSQIFPLDGDFLDYDV